MKNMKRTVALVLTFVMLLSITTVPALASVKTQYLPNYQSMWAEAKVYNAPNGDGYTPYNLQWLTGQHGRISLEAPVTTSGSVQVELFRNGQYVAKRDAFPQETDRGGTSIYISLDVSHLMTEPGEYVFLAFHVFSGFDAILYGEIARSQTYTVPANIPAASMPNPMPGWSSVIASEGAVMAIKNDNSLWVWGTDNYGMLGLDNGADRTAVEEPVKLMDGIASAGIDYMNSFLIKTDGSLWVAGYYYVGGSGESVRKHIKLMDGVAFASLNRGTLYAIKTDGTLWHWGGRFEADYKPSDLRNTGMNGVVAAAIGPDGYVIRTDGSLWKLANGTGLHRKIMDNVASITRYGGLFYAVQKDGTMWGWGYEHNMSTFSILGNGSPGVFSVRQEEPAKIMGGVVSAALSQNFILIVKTDGSLWGWGQNRGTWQAPNTVYGPLGPLSVQDTDAPIKVEDGIIYAAAGSHDTYVVKTDGTLWAWGIGGGSNHGVPAQIMTGIKFPDPLDSASSWAKAGITTAIDKGFVPADIQNNYTQKITRQEFCRMAVLWLEYKLDMGIDAIVAEYGDPAKTAHTFGDTADPNILAAYRLGVTSGATAPTDGTPGIFNPDGLFDRQSAATMILNTCRVEWKAAGIDVDAAPPADFADMDKAASWAHTGINFVRANGIMSGDGTNFNPHNTYNRQESIITFNNIT